MLNSLAVLFVVAFAPSQGVPQSVVHFIDQFSLAATQVELTPNNQGEYSHRAELARTLLGLARTDDATLDQSFELLDKNRSVQRLAAADLLLILIFDLPKGINWSDPSKLALRNVLVPADLAQKQDPVWASPTWPWIDLGQDTWKLGRFTILNVISNKSLIAHLRVFRGQFVRRKFETEPLPGP